MIVRILHPHPRAGQLADVAEGKAAEFVGGFFVRPRRAWKAPKDGITGVTWVDADEVEIVEKAA